MARYVHEAGGRVIAIADRKGATHNEKGLDIPRLTGHMARGGSLTDFEGGGPIFSGPNFLTIPCDVLVPAALGGVITAPVAQRLQCKVCLPFCRRCRCGGNGALSVSPAQRCLRCGVGWHVRCVAQSLFATSGSSRVDSNS